MANLLCGWIKDAEVPYAPPGSAVARDGGGASTSGEPPDSFTFLQVRHGTKQGAAARHHWLASRGMVQASAGVHCTACSQAGVPPRQPHVRRTSRPTPTEPACLWVPAGLHPGTL